MTKPYDYTQTAEEKEKEEKEKALKLFTAAYYYEILPARAEARMPGYEVFFESLARTKAGTEFLGEILKAFLLGREIRLARQQLQDFFRLTDAPELSKEVSESLRSLEIAQEEFPVMALCASGKNMEKLTNYIWSEEKDSTPRPEEIETVRSSSVIAAKDALLFYRDGDPKVFAGLLAEGLRCSCQGFAAAATMEYSVRWSGYTEDILYLLKSRPELVKAAGLTKRQLEIAEAVSSMARDILDGISAVNIMAECSRLKDLKLTDAQNEVLKEKISKMQKSLRGRAKVAEAWDEPVPVMHIG